MSTRNADRKTVSSNHNFHHHMQQLHKRRRISKSGLTDTNEQAVIHTKLQNHLQAPIFNIHIHMPPYEGDDIKKYLPKIQPVIHLHFDELANKMELNSQPNCNILRNLLQATSPKFGDVKFHYANKQTKENVVIESEVDKAIPFSSTNSTESDSEAESCSVTENNEYSVPENKDLPESYGSTNFSPNFKSNPKHNIKDPVMCNLHKNLKLKEAVVVLTDISKTNYYKNMVAVNNNEMCQNRENNEEGKSCDVLEKLVNNSKERNRVMVNEGLVTETVKLEKELLSVESLIPDYGKRGTEINYVDHINNGISYSKGERIVTNNLDFNATPCPEETLTALAEGCNFSKVLSWFRFPKTESFDNSSVKDFHNVRKNCTSEPFSKNEERSNEFNNQIQESQNITHPNLDEIDKIERELDSVESDLDFTDVKNDLKISTANYMFEDTVSVLPTNKSVASVPDPDYSGIASGAQSSCRGVTLESKIEVASSRNETEKPKQD